MPHTNHICIFETEHFEVASAVIRLFDTKNNKITVFTYPSAYRQFKHIFAKDMDRYEWIVKEDNESKYHFILRLYRGVKQRKTGLLYLNTISNNFIFYAWMIQLLKNVRVVVTIHDINNYFHFLPATNLRSWMRIWGKKSLIRSVQEFNVISETMVSYLQSKLPPSKKVHNIPGSVFEENKLINLAPPILERINIVVPGSVDNRRRDYEAVFQLLHQCRHLPVFITLLGAFSDPYGKAIKEQCVRISETFSNLLFYTDEIVEQPEYDRVMNEAHLIFTPSVINTIILDGSKEQYGLSISSGNVFDVVRHAKPFIIPNELRIPEGLKSSAFEYAGINDIVQFIELQHREPLRYHELLEQAVLNSRQYTIDKIKIKNVSLFT